MSRDGYPSGLLVPVSRLSNESTVSGRVDIIVLRYAILSIELGPLYNRLPAK